MAKEDAKTIHDYHEHHVHSEEMSSLELSHGHIHANTKQVLNRLARIEGHVHAIHNMVERGRDCPEVLIQIAAVRKALDNTAKVILKDHLEHCLIHAFEEGKGEESLADFEDAIDKFIR